MEARFLLDTNILIYMQKKRPPAVLARFEKLHHGEAVISVITFGELAYGAAKSIHRGDTMMKLNELRQILPVMPLPEEAAEAYGAIRFDLERRGRQIGNHDLWIAAHALVAKLTLVTNNEREFARIDGLRIENWAH